MRLELWGISSVGRALPLQGRSQRIVPAILQSSYSTASTWQRTGNANGGNYGLVVKRLRRMTFTHVTASSILPEVTTGFFPLEPSANMDFASFNYHSRFKRYVAQWQALQKKAKENQHSYCGVEQRQLRSLIRTRSRVRISPPQGHNREYLHAVCLDAFGVIIVMVNVTKSLR